MEDCTAGRSRCSLVVAGTIPNKNQGMTPAAELTGPNGRDSKKVDRLFY